MVIVVPYDEELERDVLAAPQDAPTRSVYADWLEAHGVPAAARALRSTFSLSIASESLDLAPNPREILVPEGFKKRGIVDGPLRLLVVGDFLGRPQCGLVRDRRPQPVLAKRYDALKESRPWLPFTAVVDGTQKDLRLRFASLDDFSEASLREQLANAGLEGAPLDDAVREARRHEPLRGLESAWRSLWMIYDAAADDMEVEWLNASFDDLLRDYDEERAWVKAKASGQEDAHDIPPELRTEFAPPSSRPGPAGRPVVNWGLREIVPGRNHPGYASIAAIVFVDPLSIARHPRVLRAVAELGRQRNIVILLPVDDAEAFEERDLIDQALPGFRSSLDARYVALCLSSFSLGPGQAKDPVTGPTTVLLTRKLIESFVQIRSGARLGGYATGLRLVGGPTVAGAAYANARGICSWFDSPRGALSWAPRTLGETDDIHSALEIRFLITRIAQLAVHAQQYTPHDLLLELVDAEEMARHLTSELKKRISNPAYEVTFENARWAILPVPEEWPGGALETDMRLRLPTTSGPMRVVERIHLRFIP